MALDSTLALTTLATVLDELGLTSDSGTQDARVERYIHTASQAIEKWCGRNFCKATVTETMAAPDTQRLYIARTPLVSVTSVTFYDTVISADDYEIDNADAGSIFRRTGWMGDDLAAMGIAGDALRGTKRANAVSVVYVGGYVTPAQGGTRTLPYDLEMACVLTAVSLYRSKGADRRIASETVGDASVSYGGVNTAIGRGAGGIIPDEAAAILEKYRRWSS